MPTSGVDRLPSGRVELGREPMDHDEIRERTVRSVESVYRQYPLINNVERGTYVEHMIALALEELRWRLTWPWAAWDLQHREDARIEVKQSAARHPWHQRPDSEPLPPPYRGRFGIKKPSKGYYLEDGTWKETSPPQRHADIYVFAWHPVTDLRNPDRRRRADHRRPDQWEFFVVAEESLPQDGKTDGITPRQLVKCDRAVRCAYEDLADNVAKVRESLDQLKMHQEVGRSTRVR